MTAARIHRALYAAFDMEAPAVPPAPADPGRFPIFSRPAPPVVLSPQRPADGAIDTPKR